MDNPQAFPVPLTLVDTRSKMGGSHPRLPIESAPGMTLRDWFAGQALSAAMVGSYSGESISEIMAGLLAEESYLVADAMLAERAKAGAA